MGSLSTCNFSYDYRAFMTIYPHHCFPSSGLPSSSESLNSPFSVPAAKSAAIPESAGRRHGVGITQRIQLHHKTTTGDPVCTWSGIYPRLTTISCQYIVSLPLVLPFLLQLPNTYENFNPTSLCHQVTLHKWTKYP
jgi:hypothetical protein